MPGLTRHPATARLRRERFFAIKFLIALSPGSAPGWRVPFPSGLVRRQFAGFRFPLQIAFINVRQRLVVDCRFKSYKTLVDGKQFDDRRPGIDEILERIADLTEGRGYLLIDTIGDLAGHNGGNQHQEQEHRIGLNVEIPRHVEIEIVPIHAEIVLPHIGIELLHCRRLGAVGVILAIDQFLTIGGFHTLVAEVQAGQLDTDRRQQHRPEYGPDDRQPEQCMRQFANDRQFRDIGRQRKQDRQENNECHHRIDQGDAQCLKRRGKPHRIFLNTLGSTFDVAQLFPLGHVEVVHRGAPAEDIMAGEEIRENRNGHAEKGDLGKDDLETVEIPDFNTRLFRKRVLQKVTERPAEIVDNDRNLNAEIGHCDNQQRSPDGPVFPGMILGDNGPHAAERRQAQCEIGVKEQVSRDQEVAEIVGFLFRHYIAPRPA
ncbi:hypothetical protein AT6N2_C3330 [Agrobacterium tumefaciens]|nr:hypothetical protein AT6N2_C3330 [Agrobacterium tumefaciens]